MFDKNKKSYFERITKQKPEIYFQGEKIAEPYNHPAIEPIVNSIGATYDSLGLDITEELLSASSEIVEEQINRHNHIFKSDIDALNRVKMIRELSKKTGACTHRCVGIDAINALDVVTRKIDQEKKTTYHERFITFMSKVQSEDLAIAASMTDGKGNRTKKPGEQNDPDIYVRVVAKDDKGITIRGAKAHQGRPMAVDYYLVLPGSGLGEGEEDYAVAFYTKCDAPGVKIVLGQGPMKFLEQ